MRTWAFIPRKVAHYVIGNKYYILYDSDTIRDKCHRIDNVFKPFHSSVQEAQRMSGRIPDKGDTRVTMPIPILLNVENGRPLGIEDFYSSIPYICSVMNVDIGLSDMIEIDVKYSDMLAVYDTVDDTFLNSIDTKTVADKCVDMHPLIGIIQYIDSTKVIGYFGVELWGGVLRFDSRVMQGPINPFSSESLYVSFKGEAKRRKGTKFTPMDRYEVFNQRLSRGVRHVLDDTTIYNALQISQRKQTELINSRVRKLGIKPDDWIYMTLDELKRKEAVAK